MNPLLQFRFEEVRLLCFNEHSVVLRTLTSAEEIVIEFSSPRELHAAVEEWFASPAQPLFEQNPNWERRLSLDDE